MLKNTIRENQGLNERQLKVVYLIKEKGQI
ncbi:MAG: hypothetical protein ACD_79C00355G0006, partial [uncultured bacterium]